MGLHCTSKTNFVLKTKLLKTLTIATATGKCAHEIKIDIDVQASVCYFLKDTQTSLNGSLTKRNRPECERTNRKAIFDVLIHHRSEYNLNHAHII